MPQSLPFSFDTSELGRKHSGKSFPVNLFSCLGFRNNMLSMCSESVHFLLFPKTAKNLAVHIVRTGLYTTRTMPEPIQLTVYLIDGSRDYIEVYREMGDLSDLLM